MSKAPPSRIASLVTVATTSPVGTARGNASPVRAAWGCRSTPAPACTNASATIAPDHVSSAAPSPATTPSSTPRPTATGTRAWVTIQTTPQPAPSASVAFCCRAIHSRKRHGPRRSGSPGSSKGRSRTSRTLRRPPDSAPRHYPAARCRAALSRPQVDRTTAAATYRRDVLRNALRPRWLALLALVLVVCAAFGWMGSWQLGVARDRGAQEARREVAASPRVPLEQVLQPQEGFPTAADARRVSVAGRYDPDRSVLVEGRLQRGVSGWWVVTAVRTTAGAWLPVVRGWVPSPDDPPTSPDRAPSGP